MLEENKKISELIAQKLVFGLTESEELLLTEWLEEAEENKTLYMHLTDSSYIREYERKINSIDCEKYTRILKRRIKSRKTRLFQYGAYAASVALFIACLVATFNLISSNNEGASETISIASISPGKSKAILELPDGKKLDLIAMEQQNVKIEGMEITHKSLIVNGPINNDKIDAMNKIVVPRGGEYTLILPDGTEVYINSESSISFPNKFSKEKREVILQGEAYFNVAHSLERPFIVKTEKMDILVTGTQFNVKAYKEDVLVQTTLVEGRVTVTAGDIVRHLLPSQQAQLNNADNTLSVITVDVNSYIAWKNGYFVFKGDRLADIMAVLSRWYNFNVSFEDETIKEIQFAGKLKRLESISSILDIIESTNKVNIEYDGNKINFSAK